MKKRALLVGINYTGTSNALKGCLNDSANMEAMLIARGFTDIKKVLEKEATTVGIIAGMEWLVAGAVPGDVLVMHYSGHGSQLISETEPDGFEEIICPIDLNWLDKVITDNTLKSIFNKVPNGVNTTVILDCCHSGTMLDQTESLENTRVIDIEPVTKTKKIKKSSRYLKPPVSVTKKLKGKELVDWSTSRDVNATALLIAGCKANQTSADAFIDGQAQGAATAALLKSIAKNPSISYRTLVTEMNDFMVSGRYTQRPMLDGSSSLYDQAFIEPFSFAITPSEVPVESVVVTTEEKKDTKNKIIVAAVVIAAIIAFIIFGA